MPVTSTGLVNVHVFETVRVSLVLSLCIGDVNVNVPLTYPLPEFVLKVPPLAVKACEVLLEFDIPLTLVEYDVLA